MREDAIQFGDLDIRAPTQQELKTAERVGAYNLGDVDKIARIDELANSVACGNLIIAVFVSIMQLSPKCHPQRLSAILKAYVVLMCNK